MQVTWFGHSAFRLDFAGKAVLIDPFFTGNPAFTSDPKAAVQGVTHIVLGPGIFAFMALTVLLTAIYAAGLQGLWREATRRRP